MVEKRKYIILAIPLLVDGLRTNSFWVKSQVVEKDGKPSLDFDWTDDIRETNYFDSKEAAETITNKLCEQLQPHLCSVLSVDPSDIRSLGLSKYTTLENVRSIPEKRAGEDLIEGVENQNGEKLYRTN
ncbi:hypothetical protein [Enterococcus casseliflavus]|uniref:hypothetical protein n=1 Tax=Enterococcus casseliflavus TaxID=37734 RepID=UPI00232B1F06|nr:hypothetical protein [Enterococcus casseliflavus]MDB1688345.1 hypothetical protein [Enterococcus casseliflavus]